MHSKTQTQAPNVMPSDESSTRSLARSRAFTRADSIVHFRRQGLFDHTQGCLLALFLAATSVIAMVPAAEFDHTHSLWAGVLQAHVAEGKVDYAALKKKPEQLTAYLDQLASVPESRFMKFTEEEKMSFLINLYNATTLRLIIDHYPLKSIKDIGNWLRGPWDQPIVRLMGRTYSLGDLEHSIIRRNHLDPKTHFALVCASVGCPSLRPEPYQPGRLREQLEDQGKLFLSNRAKNRIDAAAKTLYLSPIFKWYEKDFKRDSPSVAEFILPFLTPDNAKEVRGGSFKTVYLDYDWTLNDKKTAFSRDVK